LKALRTANAKAVDIAMDTGSAMAINQSTYLESDCKSTKNTTMMKICMTDAGKPADLSLRFAWIIAIWIC
jgi:hypothetical protein